MPGHGVVAQSVEQRRDRAYAAGSIPALPLGPFKGDETKKGCVE